MRSSRRHSLRRNSAIAAFVLACVVVAIAPSIAAADPPNMMGIPQQIPDAIDHVVPAPPFPHLSRIPLRAQSPGLSRRTKEFREATLPTPTGDPIFDRWPSNLGSLRPAPFVEQCRLGANAQYREVLGEHVTAAVIGFPDAMSWLDARLRGSPARSGCPHS